MSAPARVLTLEATARAVGWLTRITQVTAAAPDTSHHGEDGEWDRPATVKVREPVLGEDGRAVLTPTGKPATRIVDTGEPLVVTSTALRFQRGPVRGYAIWLAGRYDHATLSDGTRLSSPSLRALLGSEGVDQQVVDLPRA